MTRCLQLWTDPAQVDWGDQADQERLARTICVLLSCLTGDQVARVRSECVAVLVRGVHHWLEAGRGRRQLGMGLVTVVMRKMGEKNLAEELSWCWWQTAVDFPRGSLAPGFKLIRRL